ncbi:MAG: CHAT domain-containing protein [Ferruginibacter sp.]
MRFMKYSMAGIFVILLLVPLFAQDGPKGAGEIEKAIEAKDFKLAQQLLEEQIQFFIKERNTDTLASYVALAGKIGMEDEGPEKAATLINSLAKRIAEKNPAARTMRKVYIETGEFFGVAGENKKAYDACTEALKYSSAPLEIAKVENNLGVYAQRMGNAALSNKHHRKALAIREAESGADSEELYMSYNSMAGLMWYASKNDSAAYFFSKALGALSKTKPTDRNKYYRPAMLQNNISAIYSADGKITDAIRAQQDAISNIQLYIAGNDPAQKREDAKSFLFEATDNLAGFYKEIGDYKKAKELLVYSYQQKQQQLKPGHPGIFISEILIGQLYNSLHDYKEALQFLDKGLLRLKDAEGDYIFWEADAKYAQAIANANLGNIAAADACYEKSDSLYETSYQGEYSNMYLEFLSNAALFYAKNGNAVKGTAKAKKAYDYITKVQQENTLPVFFQLLNLSEVYFITGRYNEAQAFGKQGLAVVNEKIKGSTSALDSVKMEVNKPRAILMIEKAGYQLQQKKDTIYLRHTLNELDIALQLLEKRKFLIDDDESINILIADNNELISFAKKIALELYQLTNDQAYLDRVINLHESGIYNRLRARLDKQKALEFSGLPANVYEEEKKLKAAIPASLAADRPNDILMDDYVDAVNKWQQHLEKIRVQYPVYFKMRYESIFKSLPQLQASLPGATTVVRYFFIDSSLHALVLDKSNKKIIDLDASGIGKKINELLSPSVNAEGEQATLLFELHESLWKPFANDIRTKNIIVIPDGILYNLSFELLTPTPIQNYSGLAAAGLLAKHTITYHYSLFMTGAGTAPEAKNNYVAFAPGFSDENKAAYKQSVKDSSRLDRQYMTLLPQPYTQTLVKKMQDKFGGDVFLGNGSTQASFKENAGNSRIVHIGTHAEFNNEKPELSRLIFSKSGDSSGYDNSLFLYDVYNCNINTDLTILTACESGRPGYEDGEGMVSLAHAFNYAGSKTILTSLWQADEQSASFITEKFIENLAAKIPAGEALQQAKLQYLQQADGRMKSPVYWAGLVLMGDTGTVLLEPKTNVKIWLLLATAVLAGGFVVYFNGKRKAV